MKEKENGKRFFAKKKLMYRCTWQFFWQKSL